MKLLLLQVVPIRLPALPVGRTKALLLRPVVKPLLHLHVGFDSHCLHRKRSSDLEWCSAAAAGEAEGETAAAEEDDAAAAASGAAQEDDAAAAETGQSCGHAEDFQLG